MKKKILASCTCLCGYLLAASPASALNGPQSIEIDGGPLGSVNFSGGVDGFGYYITGTGSKEACNVDIYCLLGDKPAGILAGNYLFSLQKTTGKVQFTLQVGATSSFSLGTQPYEASFDGITPLYESYISIVPNSQWTISAGQIPSQEGYEALPDWTNANMLASLLYYTQNTVSRGALVSYTNVFDTINATVEFSDGYRTGVFNYLQYLLGYNFASGVYVDTYGGINTGVSGLNTTGAYGPTSEYAALYNSSMVGAYVGGFTTAQGNLSLVPEVQFQWVKANAKLGIDKESQNLGLLLLTQYNFGQSPYSIGGFLEYAVTHGTSNTWFIGPNAAAVGVSVAPTWQHRNLFARVNFGYMYLTNNKADGVSYGYGSNNDGKAQFTGVLEGGVTF